MIQWELKEEYSLKEIQNSYNSTNSREILGIPALLQGGSICLVYVVKNIRMVQLELKEE